MVGYKIAFSEKELCVVQDALAALRGLYEAQCAYGWQDDKSWGRKLCEVEEVAQKIERQTDVILPTKP